MLKTTLFFFSSKETQQQELKSVMTITMGMEQMLIMKQRHSTTGGLLKNSTVHKLCLTWATCTREDWA